MLAGHFSITIKFSGEFEPVCLGWLRPEALSRWTVVTALGSGKQHCHNEGAGSSSFNSLKTVDKVKKRRKQKVI